MAGNAKNNDRTGDILAGIKLVSEEIRDMRKEEAAARERSDARMDEFARQAAEDRRQAAEDRADSLQDRRALARAIIGLGQVGDRIVETLGRIEKNQRTDGAILRAILQETKRRRFGGYGSSDGQGRRS